MKTCGNDFVTTQYFKCQSRENFGETEYLWRICLIDEFDECREIGAILGKLDRNW